MSVSWMKGTGTPRTSSPSPCPPTPPTPCRLSSSCPGRTECRAWPRLSLAPPSPQWRRPQSSARLVKLWGRLSTSWRWRWRTRRPWVPPSPPDFSPSSSEPLSPSWSLKTSKGRRVSSAARQCPDHPVSSTAQTRDHSTAINTINKKNKKNLLTMMTGASCLLTTPPRLESLSGSALTRDSQSFLSTTGGTNYIYWLILSHMRLREV